ncbi:TetR/AcrR family transcriptional regulator [Agromyces sp. NPDC058136]|uniref:TetR/AcrR family transcriptional regulator n=1 Tax=Agromyces sp. NPDC058136 TaxID=3346354 RepID=UPI0036D9794C
MSAPDLTAAAVRLLLDRGYDATTADDLADAAGMSRSTFFRRFGSKDDIVFADHEALLERVADYFQDSTSDPVHAVSVATRMVLDHHLARPGAARERYALLQAHPPLRDRELIITRRYERVYRRYLERVAPGRSPAWLPLAFAAGIVSVHNDILRQWLHDPGFPATERLDLVMSELTALYRPLLSADGRTSTRVIVATFETGAEPRDVMQAVRETVGSAGSAE